MEHAKLEEEDLGYQRRIRIKLPKGIKTGYDPFQYPALLMPINDSFGQIPFPVDKDGHIVLTGGDPNYVVGAPVDEKKKKKKDYHPLPGDAPPVCLKGESKKNILERQEPVGIEEAAQNEYEENVVHKNVGEERITEQEYYHGLLPQEDVLKLLSRPGDFLLRVMEITSGNYRTDCITAKPMSGGSIQTFVLRKEKGRLFLSGGTGTGFDSIVNLVNHYMKTRRVFGRPPCQLLRAICRQEWEFSRGQVQCLKPIAHGAHGQVFFGKLVAKTGSNPKEVAVKQIQLTTMNKDKVEDVMREARLMRIIVHANVVRCFGICADQEPLMIVMEYVDGGALDSYLRLHGVKISVYERVNMTFEAARGLTHVHRLGIIHRDIAARNCLYAKNMLKISDFSLSRQATMYKADPTERIPIKYLAPEVFTTHTYTFQSDVWAFGVLMYEIFSNGAEPYPGMTPPQVKEIVVRQGSQLVPPKWAPDYIKGIMADCFIRTPQTRVRFSAICKTITTIRLVEKKHPAIIAQMKFARKRMGSNPR